MADVCGKEQLEGSKTDVVQEAAFQKEMNACVKEVPYEEESIAPRC